MDEIIEDQRIWRPNLFNLRDEVCSMSSMSSFLFKTINAEMMEAHSTKMISNLFEEYYWKDPVMRNDELITNFDGVNAGFRKILELYEKRKACEELYVTNSMENYDLMPVSEIKYGDLCNNPFAKNDDKKSMYTVIQYPCESESDKDSDEDSDEDSDASVDEESDIDDMAHTIQNLVIYVTTQTYLLDCPKTVRDRLKMILYMSDSGFLTTKLMDAMQKLLEPLNNKSDYVGILLNIIVNVCKNDDKAIHTIANNEKFTKMILGHLKSVDNMVLLNLLKLLQLAVKEIQNDPDSRWLNYLKECDSFDHCISVILKFPFDDTLILIATDLLKEIAKISLPNQPNFLHQLVNVHDFIPILMTCCSQRMSKINKHSPNDLRFLYNWLSIMMTIEVDLIITFEENEEKEKHILLKILFNILYPYQQAGVLSPEKKVKRHVDILFKTISLLSCLYRRVFVPSVVDNVLMNIIVNLAKDMRTRIISDENKTSSEALLLKFLKYLEEIWLSIMQRYNHSSILKLIKPFDDVGQQYFMNLGYYDPHIQYKMKKVHAELEKETYISCV